MKEKEIIINAFERRLLAFGCFIYLNEAFHNINPEILISKLQYYGIIAVAINLIASFLQPRNH